MIIFGGGRVELVGGEAMESSMDEFGREED
jgi:hypothetical protein